jgi:hypothetical protein
MKNQLCVRFVVGLALLATGYAAAGPRASAQTALALGSARITIDGTSNVHPYSASTTAVRITRAQPAGAAVGPNFWSEIVKPGGLEAFEISVAAATLSSTKDGLDKNMHKALKVQQYPDITFRLIRFESLNAGTGSVWAVGMLKIAGVEREVGLELKTRKTDSSLTVTGAIQLLMTDYGITPPKAMLGMLKTDPKITVTFETVLTVPLT